MSNYHFLPVLQRSKILRPCFRFQVFGLGFLLFMSLNPQKALAQYSHLGSWNIVNVKYNMNNVWSLFGEGQLRSLKLYQNFHYYEYKGGLNFKPNKQIAFTLGIGSYQTYREGGDFIKPKNNDELRIWPQMILYQSMGKLKVEQRYRHESRYTSKGYRNRFRYRFGLSFPFGKEKDGYQAFQLNASNELFFTDTQPYFERNRLLFTLNFKPSKASTIQVGFLRQFDYKINDETGRSFIQIGYFLEIFGKQSRDKAVDNDLKDN